MTSALIGTRIPPNIMNSRKNVAIAMIPSASGSLLKSEAFESTNRALGPPTSTGEGAVRSRTRCVSASPCGESGSTVGTTESHVPSAVRLVNRAVSVPGPTTCLPPA